jgi:hypothetical protein
VDRVEEIVQARKRPLLSTSSRGEVIAALIAQIEALEDALREVADEVARLSNQPASGQGRLDAE